MKKNNEHSQPHKESGTSKVPLPTKYSQLSNHNRTQPDYLHFSPYGTSKPSSNTSNTVSTNDNNDSNSNSNKSASLQGTSNDTLVSLRIDIEDILSLNVKEWEALYYDPYAYFMSTQKQLLSILKKAHRIHRQI